MLRPARKAGGVAHQVADLHTFFPTGRELGPVLGHRRVEVELAAISQHERAQEGHRLGRGPNVGQGVPLPQCRMGLVDIAAPHVDHGLTLEEHGDRRAHVGSGFETRGQRGHHPLESLVPRPLDVSHATDLFSLLSTAIFPRVPAVSAGCR